MPLILLLMIVAAVGGGNSPGADGTNVKMGALAGQIYPPIDAAFVLASVTMRKYSDTSANPNNPVFTIDEETPPLYLQRFLAGRFYTDNIPAGTYEVTVDGIPYDDSLKEVCKCYPFKIRPFRIAPDSVSIIITRLWPEGRYSRRQKAVWDLDWEERIYPDTADIIRLRGWDFNQPGDEMYYFVEIDREGFSGQVIPDTAREGAGGRSLTISLASNRLYPGTGAVINIDKKGSRSRYDLSVNRGVKDAAGADAGIFEPAAGWCRIDALSDTTVVNIVTDDTSSYRIINLTGRYLIEEITPGKVDLNAGEILISE